MSEDAEDGETSRPRRVAEWLVAASPLERLGIAVASVVTALLLGLVLVAVAGYDPLLFANNLVIGSVGDDRAIARTLRISTYFIVTGLAVAIAFRAGVFNIGVQGQFAVGGLTCTMSILWAAPHLPEGMLGGILLMVVGAAAAAVGGGLYGAIPGALKAYADANEIITTIMLNFIAIGAVGWLIDEHFRAEGSNVQTEAIPDYVGLPQLVFDQQNFSIVGLALVIVLVIAVAFVMRRTRFGFDMVTSGHQQSAAVYAGVRAKRTIVQTMTLSGAVAGLAAALLVIVDQGRFIDPQNLHTYGYDAIAVSLLAANNPLGTIPAGMLFGGLNSSTSHIQIHSDVPVQLIDGIAGIVILFVAAPELFRMGAKRAGIGGDGE